jgi:hypothetical protein
MQERSQISRCPCSSHNEYPSQPEPPAHILIKTPSQFSRASWLSCNSAVVNWNLIQARMWLFLGSVERGATGHAHCYAVILTNERNLQQATRLKTTILSMHFTAIHSNEFVPWNYSLNHQLTSQTYSGSLKGLSELVGCCIHTSCVTQGYDVWAGLWWVKTKGCISCNNSDRKAKRGPRIAV